MSSAMLAEVVPIGSFLFSPSHSFSCCGNKMRFDWRAVLQWVTADWSKHLGTRCALQIMFLCYPLMGKSQQNAAAGLLFCSGLCEIVLMVYVQHIP